MKTSCPVGADKERRSISKVCAKMGEKWSTKWSPTAAGRFGREWDKICRIAADRLNVTDFPSSQLFPQGIMLGYFYNFCGSKEWRDTGVRKGGDNICCMDKKIVSCKGKLYK